MLSAYKAVVFDFDFTLADSSRALCQCVNYALNDLGFAPATEKQIKRLSGFPLQKIFSTLSGVENSEQEQSFIRSFTVEADVVMTSHTSLFSGVPEVLNGLQSAGKKTAIVSTKYRYRIEDVLTLHSLSKSVDLIIGGEDVTAYKPDPQGIHLVLKSFGLTPEDILYVGDSFVDAETARNANVDFIAVTSGATFGHEFESYEPLAVMSSIETLLQYL